MSAEIENPQELIQLEVKNFMRVKALTIKADGKNVIIRGDHGAGKTSSVSALWAALGGKAWPGCDKPIHAGADEAYVKVTLTDIVVERKWTEKGSYLTVKARDGSKINRPQELLDSLVGTLTLNPCAFLELRKGEMIDQIVATGKVKCPVDEVLAITGERHEPLPNENAAAYLDRLCRENTGVIYMRRREVGRDVDRQQAALAESSRQLDLMGGPPKAGEKPQSVSDLAKRLEDLNYQAAKRRELQSAADEAEQLVQSGKDKLKSLEETLRIREIDIADLENRLATAKADREALATRINNGKGVVADREVDAGDARRAANDIYDPSAEIAAISATIKTAESANQLYAKRANAFERHQTLTDDLAKSLGEHKALDSQVVQMRELGLGLLSNVDLGVPGLSISGGEVFLNKIPFSQASTAQQLHVAFALATKENPRLRFVRCDGGERFNTRGRAELFAICAKFGLRVIMTCVSDDEELTVEIVEEVA